MSIWVRVRADSMVDKVCLPPSATVATSLKSGITKEDEDRRKEEIDQIAAVLASQGMELKKAKAKAARDWRAQNPWYAEGSTRGKVWVLRLRRKMLD